MPLNPQQKTPSPFFQGEGQGGGSTSEGGAPTLECGGPTSETGKGTAAIPSDKPPRQARPAIKPPDSSTLTFNLTHSMLIFALSAHADYGDKRTT